MNEKQHPLTLAEILDRTAYIYRSRFLVFFGIAVIPAGTVLVFFAGLVVFFAWFGSSDSSKVAVTAGNILAWSFVGLIGLLAVPVCLGSVALGWAAISNAAAQAFLGEKFSIRDAYRCGWKHRWRYVWLYLLLVILVAVAPIVVFAIGVPLTDALIFLGVRAGIGAANSVIGGAMFLLFAALVVYAVWMLLRLCLAFPACVVEQTTAWKAIKRSTALSKGTKGRMILLYLLGAALSWLLALGFLVPIGILLALVPGVNDPQHARTLGMALMFIWYGLSFLVQALTKPVYGIALTLFYFDQRIRMEGFDIEWMMQQAGMIVALPSAQEAAPPTAADPLVPGVSQS